MANHYDVIIIGAGMSGLAAGVRCAYYDKTVLILEKHYMYGGLNSFYTKDGYSFDVGLHAMTNFVPKTARRAPLNKLLRQLKLPYEAFDLREQNYSEILFPNCRLRFTNNFDELVAQVRLHFPDQMEGFHNLVDIILSYDELNLQRKPVSARNIVSRYLSNPLLIDMLFCPLMYYGSAIEDDMEFGQFVIMFKSIFNEGFARPWQGVRQITSALVRQYRKQGGEMRMRAGVRSLKCTDDRIQAVELEDGEILTADKILSSAGYYETLALIDPLPVTNPQSNAGVMTFIETIFVLDQPPADWGHDATITFYNLGEQFRYRKAEGLVDVKSGVICSPNNYQYDRPLKDNLLRLTCISNFEVWQSLQSDSEAYYAAKERVIRQMIDAVEQLIPPFRDHVIYTDAFTPLTIQRYTGHINGAVYGAPDKVKDGRTPFKNLFIIGTDQGFLGIVGAMLSGISMANLHVLQ